MCEFNSPYPVSSGHYLDNTFRRIYAQTEPVVQPQSAWDKREAELPEEEVAVIQQAVQEAADTNFDVHLYRKIGSRFLGLAFEPGDGPRVKIWEH